MAASKELWEDLKVAAQTGCLVGALDVAALWPMVTLATRREAGESFGAALGRGKLWSGSKTALTMLVPYSVAVEAVTAWLRSTTKAESNADKMWVAPLVSLAVAAGLQPVEKKLVLEQLAKERNLAATHMTVRDMWAYAKSSGGLRALWAGFPALWARETLYIASVTVLNPLAAASVPYPPLAAFAVGFSAGMLTAPLQSVNVVCKDERNRGVSQPWRSLFANGWSSATVDRLFYGAFPRSLRIGCAGVLWYFARQLTSAWNG